MCGGPVRSSMDRRAARRRSRSGPAASTTTRRGLPRSVRCWDPRVRCGAMPGAGGTRRRRVPRSRHSTRPRVVWSSSSGRARRSTIWCACARRSTCASPRTRPCGTPCRIRLCPWTRGCVRPLTSWSWRVALSVGRAARCGWPSPAACRAWSPRCGRPRSGWRPAWRWPAPCRSCRSHVSWAPDRC